MDMKEADDEIVCLDKSFFINDDYRLTTFSFGTEVLQLFCLHSASTDFDLTGQLVWPGALLMNDYISKNAGIFSGRSVIELGSGVGATGILLSRFSSNVVLTDHNEEVLKILRKNIGIQSCDGRSSFCGGLAAERLEWGNCEDMDAVLSNYSGGFDLVVGADICFQQWSIPSLFCSVERLLRLRERGECRFILAYVSRAKVMDVLVMGEAGRHGMRVVRVPGVSCSSVEGVIYEMTLC